MKRTPKLPRSLLLRARPATGPRDGTPKLLTRETLEARRADRRALVTDRTRAAAAAARDTHVR